MPPRKVGWETHFSTTAILLLSTETVEETFGLAIDLFEAVEEHTANVDNVRRLLEPRDGHFPTVQEKTAIHQL